jgi:thymidylate synthase (FAD)
MSKIEVTYLDHMGTDLDVVNAARVSFKKVSDALSEPDKKLLKYLANHGPFSPFTHCYLKFHIKAPIFVARQLQKHRVGLSWWDDEDADSLSWNEVSRRYVDDEPEFFEPDTWRARADNVKQGSSEETVEVINHQDGREDIWGDIDNKWHPSLHHQWNNQSSKDYYDWFITSNICPEQARMILPQSTMTEWIWSGSLFGFIRVCKQRLDAHAQRETQEIAKQLAPVIHQYFPYSYEALLNV